MTCSGGLFLHEEGNNNDLLLIDGRAPLKAIGNDRANRAVVENPLLDPAPTIRERACGCPFSRSRCRRMVSALLPHTPFLFLRGELAGPL